MVLQTIAQSIWHLQPFLISGLFSRPLRSIQLGPAFIGGRCRIRTCDFHRVKVALYR